MQEFIAFYHTVLPYGKNVWVHLIPCAVLYLSVTFANYDHVVILHTVGVIR